jgi:hypothetical protein
MENYLTRRADSGETSCFDRVKAIFDVGAKMYSYASEEIGLPWIRFPQTQCFGSTLVVRIRCPLFAVTLIPADAECVG